MAVFWVIVTLGLGLIGYLVMGRIDRFLGGGGILDSPEGRANRGVLVYGAPDALPSIEKAGFRCGALADAAFPEDALYAALFALSGDDRANLALIQAAKRIDPGIYILARCNAPELRPVYQAAGADHLIGADEPVAPLISQLGGSGQ